MIYLDHNATTPVHPRVFAAMEPFLKEGFGNASGLYQLGRNAKIALEEARAQVASCLGALPEEVVFTAGGTESDNLALRGVTRALREKGRHIVTMAIEHHAVMRTCEDLQEEGFEVTFLPVDTDGRVDPDEVRRSLRSDTILLSVMHANNEVGTIQPLQEIGEIARAQEVVFHTDAVQAIGKIPVDVEEIGVDLLSLSAHKLYGPKGAGALYVKKGTPLLPVLTGGHHEHSMRAGTENVAGIVGLATAVEIATASLDEEGKRLASLRNRLEKEVLRRIEHVRVNAGKAPRVSNTSNMSFQSVDGESILLHLDLQGICASTGSACTTDSPEPSHVLLAMGADSREAQGSIRFSLGKDNTKKDIDTTVEALVEIVGQLRAISSL